MQKRVVIGTGEVQFWYQVVGVIFGMQFAEVVGNRRLNPHNFKKPKGCSTLKIYCIRLSGVKGCATT